MGVYAPGFFLLAERGKGESKGSYQKSQLLSHRKGTPGKSGLVGQSDADGSNKICEKPPMPVEASFFIKENNRERSM